MRRLPAEWEEQSAILLALPHANSDWAPYLDEALDFYKELISAIAKYQKVLLVCDDKANAMKLVGDNPNVILVEAPTNDTWARDFGFITVEEGDKPLILDFEFNGWGLKFASNHDNQLNSFLYKNGFVKGARLQKTGWVLEGGSIESDGKGTILTTTTCLLSLNRDPFRDREAIELKLKNDLGAKRVLWLENGHLENDDTDAHIDTLARFCDERTIAYVGCDDESDHHFIALKAMEDELKKLVDFKGNPYRLIKLPMVDPIHFDGERLPATYANFLILNGAVIVPTYGARSDREAIEILSAVFEGRQIIAINAEVLVRQHGSIHCVTMQIPASIAV